MRAKFFIVLTLVVLRGAPAFAQDFFGAGVTAQTAARAGIYVPDSSNALDALALNPAGLSALTGPTLNLSTLGLLARGSFSNAANVNSPMRFTAGAIPYGAVGMPLGHRWTVAAGFLPDLLSAANWQFHDASGTAGANYGAQNETSRILAFRSAAGASYALSRRVSVGVSVSAVYNSNTLIMPYVFQSNPDLKGLKTLLDLHTTGLGWNAGAGLTAKLSRRWQIGASYRSVSSITSTGNATGNMGAQFAALGIPFRPDFSYSAQVKVQLPQAAIASAIYQMNPKLRFNFESGWTGWSRSFNNLPVTLANGNNSQINSFLGSTGIQDIIPLNWKDQFSFRGSFERKLGENLSASGGYSHANSPVPSSTLTPLTAAIMSNGLTAGLGYRRGIVHFNLAYQFDFAARQSVGASGLEAGEFSNSRVRAGTQGLILTTSLHL
jgi:long-subunit fatty acid transport protein